MALNFYGSCKGSSASKYDIWINARQNSQSIEDNKSNITIKVFLKRNDGYAASAYNLNENSNTVNLSVGGAVKVNGNLSIDTRNGATVALASWTGDVSHKSDGSLSLEIASSFTMGGTSLSGGSVNGIFSLTDIPRASSITMDKSALNPSDSVTFSITTASSQFSHKISLSLGSNNVSYTLSAGNLTKTVTIPKTWAEAVTTAKYKYITVTLATYKGTKKIGSKEYKLKLTIPSTDEYLPEFSLVVTRVDGEVPEGFGEYVKNKSRVTVSLSDLSLKYGATESSCVVKVGSLSGKSLPATFELNESGTIPISVSLKDSRGYVVKNTESIVVRDYKEPSIEIKDFFRCDENGSFSKEGTSLYVSYDLLFSSVNAKNTASIKAKYKKTNETTWSAEEVPTENGILFKNALDYGSSYDVSFIVSDFLTAEGVENLRTLSSSNIPFNIKRGGGGAAFGCYSENDNELTVAWDLNVLGSVHSEEIAFTTDSTVAENEYVVAKYIPSLNLCFLRIRVDAAAELAAESSHTIGSLSKMPKIFTPLSFYVSNDFNCALKGGIRSGGAVFFSTSHSINKGERIYISGVFICDSENS